MGKLARVRKSCSLSQNLAKHMLHIYYRDRSLDDSLCPRIAIVSGLVYRTAFSTHTRSFE